MRRFRAQSVAIVLVLLFLGTGGVAAAHAFAQPDMPRLTLGIGPVFFASFPVRIGDCSDAGVCEPGTSVEQPYEAYQVWLFVRPNALLEKPRIERVFEIKRES